MEWFRSRIRLGGRLALAALALNLVVAFGHHHFDEIAHLAAPQHASTTGDPDGDDHGHHDPVGAHPCFSCFVLMAAAVAATPPALPPRSVPRIAAVATVMA